MDSLQRSIASKDALIKDLRLKLQTLEETIEKGEFAIAHQPETTSSSSAHATEDAAAAAAGDLSKLSASELRVRLRASELERTRSRNRLNALKDKILEVESECKLLKDENDKLRKLGERFDSMKTTIARKDANLKVLRAQHDKLKTEHEDLVKQAASKQAEMDKRLK